MIKWIAKTLNELKKLWIKHKVEGTGTVCRHEHKKFVPALKGMAVSKLKESDISRFSSSSEYNRPETQREGAVQTYFVRNPKTGTVVVMIGTLQQLKHSFPSHEVVEPEIR